jgi:hypothetical protein
MAAGPRPPLPEEGHTRIEIIPSWGLYLGGRSPEPRAMIDVEITIVRAGPVWPLIR